MSKSKNTNDETESLAATVARSLLRMIMRPRLLLLAALACCGLFAVPRLAVLLPRVASRREYQISVDDIRLAQRASHVPADLVEQVFEQSGLPRRFSLLDEQIVCQVAEAFHAHPWVASVRRIEKRLPASIVVRLEYRKPVAMVQVPGGLYPIDREGRVLPPDDFTFSATRKFPIVAAVCSVPRGPVGTKWGDPAVVGAARLAAVLLEQSADGISPWTWFQLASIHVPQHRCPADAADNLVFELQTLDGSRIIWGRPPGTSHPGELAPEQKINRLAAYLERFGGFSDRHAWQIDIRHWQEISRQRIAMSGEASACAQD